MVDVDDPWPSTEQVTWTRSSAPSLEGLRPPNRLGNLGKPGEIDGFTWVDMGQYGGNMGNC